jgi:fumarylacetoacetate (FAA) hydrolase
MKLATLDNGTPDGRLVVVSSDGRRCADAAKIAPTLQQALERWSDLEHSLRDLQQSLDEGRLTETQPFSVEQALAPLPRAWQWLDGSAFQSHGDLMSTVFKLEKLPYDERPLMYQGLSDRFIAPHADVPLPSDTDGIDFEGEFGVITDAVPMGVSPVEALRHIRLVVMINDWSLRRIAPIEMTPDELGAGWRDARVQMRLEVDWNDRRFGAAHGGAMAFGFDQLVAHAAYSRDLVAGTIIGSGTVSNDDFRTVGSSCIAERRAIEILDYGEPQTPYMSFGDRVRMRARFDDGREGPFGTIDQRVVPLRRGQA